MAAVIRRIRFHDGSIRLGPECCVWGDDYTHSLSFELIRVNVALVGGLNWILSREEYRWLEDAFIKEGLRAAMDRVVKDKDGKPLLDESGKPILRRVMMAMPGLRREKR